MKLNLNKKLTFIALKTPLAPKIKYEQYFNHFVFSKISNQSSYYLFEEHISFIDFNELDNFFMFANTMLLNIYLV